MRVPWTARRSNQSILKEGSPGCSLQGLMLKLKLQYFGDLMRRVDSLEKTLILGGIEGRRRRGRSRMRWLDGIIPSKEHPVQFSSVQSLSRVRLFVTPCIAARQASLSITISRSSLRLTSIESVMPSSHLILYRPLLLLPPIPPSIRVFSNESTLRMRSPK